MKTRTVWVRASLLLLLSMTQAETITLADDGAIHKGRMTSKIDYRFVGHLEQLDDEGRLLVWEGPIEGDLAGRIKWWFVQPPPVTSNTYMGGKVVFYAARWEIWSGEELLLAGESAGKTVFPDGADGIWDGHGMVIQASRSLSALIGRKVYETGPVIVGSDPPVSFSGTGIFVVY